VVPVDAHGGTGKQGGVNWPVSDGAGMAPGQLWADTLCDGREAVGFVVEHLRHGEVLAHIRIALGAFQVGEDLLNGRGLKS
jgi:hypothetical protein